MAALRELIDSYRAGVDMLRTSVAGLTRDQLFARPVAGKWSVQEVVCHLADFEPILADRIKRVLAEDRPTLVGADETLFAAALAYEKRAIEDEISLIDLTRRQVARILEIIPQEALTRVGIHTERGPCTLEQLVATAARHIPHHVKFISEKRKALGLPA